MGRKSITRITHLPATRVVGKESQSGGEQSLHLVHTWTFSISEKEFFFYS